MSVQATLRGKFTVAADAVPGIASAIDHEPESLPTLPCVTMLALPPMQRDVATGGVVELTLTWRVMVYVGLGNGYDVAQDTLADLLEPLLAITRSDPNATGSCDFWELSGDGSEPQFAHQEGWVFQRLRLVATIETS